MKRSRVMVWIGLFVLSGGLLGATAQPRPPATTAPAVERDRPARARADRRPATATAPARKLPATTPVRRDDDWWVKRHESFNERARQGNVGLVFIGDSITHSWENQGSQAWEKYYEPRRAMNLGIGGDQTRHVLWRLDHGNLEGIAPKAAALMIGTNNASGDDTAEEIADGVTAIVRLLRKKLPGTKILILGIFPRGENPNPMREKIAQTNEIVSKLADGKMVYYMDIGVHFLTPDQTITTEIMPDYLHLTPRGYEMWAIAIEGKLRELLGEAP